MSVSNEESEFVLITEATGLSNDQLENLKKGFEGFDKDASGTISQTSMKVGYSVNRDLSC